MTSLALLQEITGIVGPPLAAFAGLWWRLEVKFRVQEKGRAELKDSIHGLELKIAENYVTASQLSQTEARILREISQHEMSCSGFKLKSSR